jgi:hypothetical protein
MRGEGAGLPRPIRPEEQQHAGPQPEEDMAIWLLPDLSQRQYVPVEPFRPIQVGHIERGF